MRKFVVEKHMLDNLIKKYKHNDIQEVVYKLTFAGKFIIVKGKTLCGSLMIIADTFDYFTKNKQKYENHLYINLYNHYIRHRNMRFTIKVLAKKDAKTTQYNIIKREQMELDKAFGTQPCLNSNKEAYLPHYRPITGGFGWIERHAGMNFKKWLTSKERAVYQKRYCNQS
jgi:hypothetical protein